MRRIVVGFAVVLVAAACSSHPVSGSNARPPVAQVQLRSPLLDRCSQLDVEKTLRTFGRPEVLGLASVSTLDGMACSFDVPGSAGVGISIGQALADGLHPVATLDELVAQGGKRMSGIGSGAVVVASGPVAGGQASVTIEFDLGGSRWTVDVYGPSTGSDRNLRALAQALCGDILPIVKGFGPLTVAEVRADPASPPAGPPTDAAVSAVLGTRSRLVSTVYFSRDYRHDSYHRARNWFASDVAASMVISLRGGAHSATPREASAAELTEYNAIVQNPRYLQTEAPTKPVGGLGPGALVDVRVTTSPDGRAYRAYVYTFKRGQDLYVVSVGGNLATDIGPQVYALVKEFYDRGV